jgi:hypothetical protein
LLRGSFDISDGRTRPRGLRGNFLSFPRIALSKRYFLFVLAS